MTQFMNNVHEVLLIEKDDRKMKLVNYIIAYLISVVSL